MVLGRVKQLKSAILTSILVSFWVCYLLLVEPLCNQLQLDAYTDDNTGAYAKPLRRRRVKRGPQQLLR